MSFSTITFTNCWDSSCNLLSMHYKMLLNSANFNRKGMPNYVFWWKAMKWVSHMHMGVLIFYFYTSLICFSLFFIISIFFFLQMTSSMIICIELSYRPVQLNFWVVNMLNLSQKASFEQPSALLILIKHLPLCLYGM